MSFIMMVSIGIAATVELVAPGVQAPNKVRLLGYTAGNRYMAGFLLDA